MQLRFVAAALTLLGVSAPAAAAGLGRPELTGELRFNYYYELSTLVYEPMVSLDVAIPSPIGRTTVGADYTLDAVTSASLGFGARIDEVIYELRNEVAGAVSHDFGAVAAGVSYRYSKECRTGSTARRPDGSRACDYTAGSVAAFAELALLNETFVLRGLFSYGHDVPVRPAGKRLGLDTWYGGLYALWILDKRTIVRLGYDLMFQDGFQSNFYRNPIVGGVPSEERHPLARWRHTFVLGLKHRFPELGATGEIEYRYYRDGKEWEITGQDVGIRTYFDLGRWWELRVGYRLYAQNGAKFWKSSYGDPEDRTREFYTGDPKLSRFQSHLFGARVELDLSFLDGIPVLEALRWVDFRYDYMLQNNAYGNAHVLGATVAFAF